MELKERRLTLIDETVSFYIINNRAETIVDGLKMCVYSPVEGVSEGCAIGRLIANKENCKQMDVIRGCIDDPRLVPFIPIDIMELGIDFLARLQYLHDQGRFWNERGITEDGIDYANNLKIIYK